MFTQASGGRRYAVRTLPPMEQTAVMMASGQGVGALMADATSSLTCPASLSSPTSPPKGCPWCCRAHARRLRCQLPPRRLPARALARGLLGHPERAGVTTSVRRRMIESRVPTAPIEVGVLVKFSNSRSQGSLLRRNPSVHARELYIPSNRTPCNRFRLLVGTCIRLLVWCTN